ncbi:unnamed protein product [Urochloa decumbens]|uniref:Uncharacterized protein n=1 Tax=Urochloa decumbens TaxID=240449 RepID=A0ABC9FFT9_9POAL
MSSKPADTTMADGERQHDDAVRGGAIDEAFASAPAAGDPACSRHADALRAQLEAWVDGVRAGVGLHAISAAADRRRRAADHRDMALEFAQRRKVAVGLEGDELCRSVQAAMDARVVGSCAYCGCNFSVVAVADLPGLGGACGVCGRRVRLHDPAPPVVRDPPANAEERWKGWLPW